MNNNARHDVADRSGDSRACRTTGDHGNRRRAPPQTDDEQHVPSKANFGDARHLTPLHKLSD